MPEKQFLACILLIRYDVSYPSAFFPSFLKATVQHGQNAYSFFFFKDWDQNSHLYSKHKAAASSPLQKFNTDCKTEKSSMPSTTLCFPSLFLFRGLNKWASLRGVGCRSCYLCWYPNCFSPSFQLAATVDLTFIYTDVRVIITLIIYCRKWE